MNDAGADTHQPVDSAPPPEPPSGAVQDGFLLRTRKIRVFLVDDHPLLRQGLQTLLNMQADLQVCGEAIGVASAKEGIGKSQPEVVVVDLALEDGTGFDLLEWLHWQQPHLKPIVFTSDNDTKSAERAYKSGALGYVVKYDGTPELVLAIRTVMQNQAYISKRFAGGGCLHVAPRSKG